MKRTSTEGFGVIDLIKLYDFKQSFGYFALQLMYPEKLDFHPAFLEEAFSSGHPGYAHVHTYWSMMQNFEVWKRFRRVMRPLLISRKTAPCT